MTPEGTAAAVKKPIGDFGRDWMGSPVLRERAKAELGLRGRAMYHLGRVGVLGDVSVETATAVEAFFPPEVVRTNWEQGRALREPREAALAYSGFCSDVARERFADEPDVQRLVELLERVVDGAEALGLPLFAGWRAMPRPNDAPGRLGLLVNVMREHRGSAHAAAVAAVGLGPLEAILAGTYGADNARFFEWEEPYPDASAYRPLWEAAEDLTSAAAAVPYRVLSAEERAELVELVGRVLAPA